MAASFPSQSLDSSRAKSARGWVGGWGEKRGVISEGQSRWGRGGRSANGSCPPSPAAARILPAIASSSPFHNESPYHDRPTGRLRKRPWGRVTLQLVAVSSPSGGTSGASSINPFLKTFPPQPEPPCTTRGRRVLHLREPRPSPSDAYSLGTTPAPYNSSLSPTAQSAARVVGPPPPPEPPPEPATLVASPRWPRPRAEPAMVTHRFETL